MQRANGRSAAARARSLARRDLAVGASPRGPLPGPLPGPLRGARPVALALLGASLLGACAGSGPARTTGGGTSGADAPRPRRVEVLDASYALDVEGDAVTGSLAVEVADPAAAADRTRRLSPRELDLGGRGPWLPPVLDPASRARIHAEVSADGSTLHWRAPRALPLGTVDPRDVADGLAGSADGAAAARDAPTASSRHGGRRRRRWARPVAAARSTTPSNAS